MEEKSDDTQVSRVYLSQGKAEHDIHDQVCIGMQGVKESGRWSHKTSRGKDGISHHEFNRHLEKSNVDEDHDTSCREVSEGAIE